MEPGYIGRLVEGLRDLAASPGPLRQRVQAAYLRWMWVQQELPDFVEMHFEGLSERLSKVSDPQRGDVEATLAAMSDKEVEEVASSMVDLFVNAVLPDWDGSSY